MSGNVPILFPPTPIRDNWQPKAYVISNISLSPLAVVTTDGDHGYFTGMAVRVMCPPSFGMAIPPTLTKITVIAGNTFFTEIDTTDQLPFVSPAFPTRFTPAQVVPVSGFFKNIAPIGI